MEKRKGISSFLPRFRCNVDDFFFFTSVVRGTSQKTSNLLSVSPPQGCARYSSSLCSIARLGEKKFFRCHPFWQISREPIWRLLPPFFFLVEKQAVNKVVILTVYFFFSSRPINIPLNGENETSSWKSICLFRLNERKRNKKREGKER